MKILFGTTVYNVQVIHVNDFILNGYSHPLRGTIFRLWYTDQHYFQAHSICKPPDQFSRKIGRKMAYTNFMKRWGNWFTKESRRVIFNAVCPEFSKKLV